MIKGAGMQPPFCSTSLFLWVLLVEGPKGVFTWLEVNRFLLTPRACLFSRKVRARAFIFCFVYTRSNMAWILKNTRRDLQIFHWTWRELCSYRLLKIRCSSQTYVKKITFLQKISINLFILRVDTWGRNSYRSILFHFTFWNVECLEILMFFGSI